MPLTKTPLRYPGGKSQLRPLVGDLLSFCDSEIETYVEPFCGGAGVAMDLLLSGRVSRVWLNDLDLGIYSFWVAVKKETDRLIEWIENVELSVAEWDRQRAIVKETRTTAEYDFKLGAAYFYMSRTNRSGVISGGIIGGRAQEGKYKLDCRFNKKNLTTLIGTIGSKSDRIVVTNFDATDGLWADLESSTDPDHSLVFFDPPYVEKSDGLYLNKFTDSHHAALRDTLLSGSLTHWLVTYDDAPLVRNLYSSMKIRSLPVRYSASRRRQESELLLVSQSLDEYFEKT